MPFSKTIIGCVGLELLVLQVTSISVLSDLVQQGYRCMWWSRGDRLAAGDSVLSSWYLLKQQKQGETFAAAS